MKLSVARTLVLGMVLAVEAAGQARGGDFDELARRAADALDARPEEAAALYRKALSLRPTWAEGWLYMGASLFELRRYAESCEALRKGAALAPGKGTPWAFLGMAEYELGQYQQALSHILKGEAIGLADNRGFVVGVRTRAALLYLRSSDFAQAAQQLRPLARAGYDSPEAIEALGLSALAMNTLPANLPAAKRPLVELAGRAAWAFLGERAEQSRPLFQQLGAKFPAEPGVHYMCGVFYMDHDPGAAEDEFRQELRIAPSHVLARVQWALLLIKRGEAKKAAELAGEAVRLEPSNALCHLTLGRALLSEDRTAEAIAALEKAAKLAPDNARTHFHLEQAYKRAGRDADARKEKAEFNRLRAEQEPVTVPNP